MTGQAVALDLGQAVATSPGGMREIGRRLALLAKAKVYSIPVDFSGPALQRDPRRRAPRCACISPSPATGLTAAGKPLQSFEVAGADRVFHAAKAAIEGDAVVVHSPRGQGSRWPCATPGADAPMANLYNGAGLPAAPFRSDDW